MRFEILKGYMEMCKQYGLQPDLRDLNKYKEISE